MRQSYAQDYLRPKLTCSANLIPDEISVDVSAMQIGQSVHLSNITLPEGVSPKDVRDEMRSRYNTVIGGGQERLKDSIIRIGHLGFFSEEDLTVTLEQIDTVVKHLQR